MPLQAARLRCCVVVTTASVTLAGWSAPTILLGGMPSPTLSDLPRYWSLADTTSERLQAFSFFVVGLLVCVALVRLLWNSLARDFPRLPRLTFFRSFSLVAVWGLLFLLVLTMISGARELMTPGAWVKSGLTYQLAVTPREQPIDRDEAESRARLTRLYEKLSEFAAGHQGRVPVDIPSARFGARVWLVPGPHGLSYIYSGAGQAREPPSPLVVEPDQIREPRLALWTDGSIRYQSQLADPNVIP